MHQPSSPRPDQPQRIVLPPVRGVLNWRDPKGMEERLRRAFPAMHPEPESTEANPPPDPEMS